MPIHLQPPSPFLSRLWMAEFAASSMSTTLAHRSWWATLLALWGCVFFLVGRYFNPNNSPTIVADRGIHWGTVFGGIDSHILGMTSS